MKTYQQTALAIAMCALAGAAVAQSSSPSGSTPNSGSSTTATQPATGSSSTGSTTQGSQGTSGMNQGGRVNQGTQGTTGMSQGSGTTGSSGTARMPSRTDSADSAYRSLDASNRGYLSKTDVQGLSGFNFDQADANHDGRLTRDEFAKAWGQSK